MLSCMMRKEENNKRGELVMDITEKATIRIEHWIKHNEDHLQEYETFARELEAAGKNESARHIRQMATLMAESNEYLRQALKALD